MFRMWHSGKKSVVLGIILTAKDLYLQFKDGVTELRCYK